MKATAPIDPNHQLRWAMEHLPSPLAERGTDVRIGAPASLDGDSDDTEEIQISFQRSSREVEGRKLEGWQFEGPVVVDATDTSVESGYPGTRSWLTGKLGPYCLDLEVLRDDGGSAMVRAFATTRDILDLR